MSDGRRNNRPPAAVSLAPEIVAEIGRRALAGWKYQEIAASLDVALSTVSRYAVNRHRPK